MAGPVKIEQEKTTVSTDAALLFSLVYQSFEQGSSTSLVLANIRKPPFTDVLIVENVITGATIHSGQYDFEQRKQAIFAELDTFFDGIIPGGSTHVHQVTKGQPDSSIQDVYFYENTYRIPTLNPKVELIVVGTSDDRSHSWDFKLERKKQAFLGKVLHAFTPVFDRRMQPPDR